MSPLWSALGAELRGSVADRALARAASGVREWQAALHDAVPGALRCDAWPREADLQDLLDPLAHSPLAGMPVAQAVVDEQAHGEPGRIGVAHPALAPQPASSHRTAGFDVVARTTRHAPLPAGAATPSAARRTAALDSTAASTPVDATPAAGSAAGAARVAALLARHPAPRASAVAAPAAPGGTRAPDLPSPAPSPGPGKVAALPLRRTAKPVAPTLPERGSATLARWSQARETSVAPSVLRVRALLDAAASAGMPASPIGPERLRASRASDAVVSPSAGMPQAAAAQVAERSPASPAPPGELPPVERAALAGMAAALARIESRLASPAPEPPQWLEDDDRLAQRIHDILRHQARRHGIDTP